MATKIFKLSEIVKFSKKSHRKAGDGLLDGKYPFFTSSQVQSKWLNEADYKEESIILGTGGLPSIHIAKDFSTSADTFILTSTNSSVSIRYLYFFLSGNIELLEKGFKGAGLKHLSKQYTEKILIPVPVNKNGQPDLVEQNRIILLLEQAVSLKEKKLEVYQKMVELNKSLFMNMFKSDIDNVKSYIRLEKEITYLTSGARGWAKYYCNQGGSKYIRIQNVKSSKLLFDDIQYVKVSDSAESKRIKVAQGDLLVSITADLGRTAVVDEATAKEGAYINQHIALIRLSAAYNPLFVSYFLESDIGRDQFLKYGQAAAKKGLNFDSIKSLKIPRPSIELQNKFADLVKEIEQQKDKQKESTQKVDELFNALMAKSFA